MLEKCATTASTTSTSVQIAASQAGTENWLLPQIEFPRSIIRSGLSRSTLESLPQKHLVGVVPPYADMAEGDTIHLCMAIDGLDEVHVGAGQTVSIGELTNVRFPSAALDRLGADGDTDFYYYVEKRTRAPIQRSRPSRIDVLLRDAPRELPSPIVVTEVEALVTENDIRPSLTVIVPSFSPPARRGDVIVLTLGDAPLQLTRVEHADGVESATTRFAVPYADIWSLANDQGDVPFRTEFSYRVYRNGVSGVSMKSSTTVELSVPGGRDPHPDTSENEALPRPILRGATGTQDNVINASDVDMSAKLIINPVSPYPKAYPVFAAGDEITATLDGLMVGVSVRVQDPTASIELEIPSIDLRLNAGTPTAAYTVVRHLASAGGRSLAYSPGREVRIHTAHDLPGGGTLSSAIFVAAMVREAHSGLYALYLRDVAVESTPLRIRGYLNMAEGDVIEVSYAGYDAFEGGALIPSTSGTITHIVDKYDLVEKDDGLDSDVKRIFVDIPFDSTIVKKVAFGRIESSYEVRNRVGVVSAVNRSTLISART